eukprot:3208636-Prymnesium_polylepis.1
MVTYGCCEEGASVGGERGVRRASEAGGDVGAVGVSGAARTGKHADLGVGGRRRHEAEEARARL